MVCCRQRLSFVGLGDGAEHMVGFGSVSVVDTNIVLMGTFGRGTGSLLRGSCFSRAFIGE